jgi:hypothetical protein
MLRISKEPHKESDKVAKANTIATPSPFVSTLFVNGVSAMGCGEWFLRYR